MGQNHEWTTLRVRRRDGESAEQHANRLAEIEEIVSGFRWGRYTGAEAERREQRLAELMRSGPARRP